MNNYFVKKYIGKDQIEIEVPGSKSITNRALMLAALSNGVCKLKGVLFSDDSRAFISCLVELGFKVLIEEEHREVVIHGRGGEIPNRNAHINVKSAGTAARFLTAMLAVAGGDYVLQSSEQMKKRPMQPLLNSLRDMGVMVNCLEEEDHFPFEIHSKGINADEITMDTTKSSQFVSALLMAGVMVPEGLKVRMSGSRTEGAYIKLTLAMMEQFGIQVVKEDNVCDIPYNSSYTLDSYQIEPDVSGACYFYGMAVLLGITVLVKHVHLNSLQGDIKFLQVLKELGATIEETNIGVSVQGNGEQSYPGIVVDMNDFSDQTMTMAVLAPFASSQTIIQNVSHIRFQETDRISAIVNELNRLGITCKESEEHKGIIIEPGNIIPTTVETYDDHRMAMAFTLIGLRVGGVTISDYMCCRKTFENFFDLIDGLMEAKSN